MSKFVAVLAVTFLVAADDTEKEEAKSDKVKLQGTWQFVSIERKGKPTPDAEDYKLVIDGDTLMIKSEKVTFKGKFKLDSSKTPRTMDLEYGEGGRKEYRGKVSKGIYALDGDTLKWCFAEPGIDHRPKEFTASPETNHELIILKRGKK